MAKSPKLILDNQALEDEFFEDVKLFGIVAPTELYHFMWQIEQHLAWQFKRAHDFEINIKECVFPVYHSVDESKFLEQFILSNRSNSIFLMQELKHIDILWMLKGNVQMDTLSQIHNFLKSIPQVTSTFELNPYQLKMKQYLIM